MTDHVTITRNAWLRLLGRVEALEIEVAALRAESRAERAEAADKMLHWYERTRWMPNDVAANARDKTTFGQQFGDGAKPEERKAWRTAGAVREAEQARATAVNEIMQTVDHHTDLSSDEYSDLAAAVAGILARRL